MCTDNAHDLKSKKKARSVQFTNGSAYIYSVADMAGDVAFKEGLGESVSLGPLSKSSLTLVR